MVIDFSVGHAEILRAAMSRLGVETMKKSLLAVLIAALMSLAIAPAYAGHTCNDGWHSNSDGPGTCSHHGGEGD